MNEKTVERMAKYIMNADVDYCSECCADYEACNAEMKKMWKEHEHDAFFEPPLPSEETCIQNIIKFFENETAD